MNDRSDVKRYFEHSASAFDRLYDEGAASPLLRYLNRTFRSDIYQRYLMTLEHIRTHSLRSVLDVGCGPGRYFAGYAEAGIQTLLGIDFSAEMIALARRNADRLPLQGMDLRLVTGNFLEFRPGQPFDLAVAMGVFDYLRDPVEALHTLKGMSTHSVLVSFPSRSLVRTPLRRIRYYFKKCPVYFYRREALAEFGRTVGFSKIEIVKIKGAGMDYVAAYYK